MRSSSSDLQVVRKCLSWTVIVAAVILLMQGISSADGGGGGSHSGPPTKMPDRVRAAGPMASPPLYP